MSIPIIYSSALTTNIGAYVTGQTANISGQTLIVGLGSGNTSTSNRAIFSAVTGSNAITTTFWSFDCSNIPENATINSVSCSIGVSLRTANMTATTRFSAKQVQLYNGTDSPKGSAVSFGTSTGNTGRTVYILSGSSWTREELDNCNVRVYLRRGTGNTSTSHAVYVYGATLAVNYSVNGLEYEVSISNSSTAATTDPGTGTTYVIEGGNQDIIVCANTIAGVSLTDNNVEQTLITEPVYDEPISVTLDQPTGYTREGPTEDQNYPGTNGLNSSANTSSYARFYTRSETNEYVYYDFAASSLPHDSLVTSVICTLRAGEGSNNYGNKCVGQLCIGKSPIGTQADITATATTGGNLYTVSVSSITPEQASQLKLRLGIRRGEDAPSYFQQTLYFLGATLTITYQTKSGEYATYTISNISVDHKVVIADKPSYNILITNTSSSAATDPATTQTLFLGQSQEIKIYTDNIDSVTVLDDNVPVNLVTVYQTGYTTPTSVSAIPNSLVACTFSYSANITSAYTDGSSNARYATFSGGTGGGPGRPGPYAEYSFGLPNIPNDAKIESVTCRASFRGYTTSDFDVQLYSNETAKGNATQVETTTLKEFIIEAGEWERSELDDLKIRFWRGSYSNQVVYFHGATLTVNYSLPYTSDTEVAYYSYTIPNISSNHNVLVRDKEPDSIWYKDDEGWKKSQKVYKKVNEAWVEQTDFSTIFTWDDTRKVWMTNKLYTVIDINSLVDFAIRKTSGTIAYTGKSDFIKVTATENVTFTGNSGAMNMIALSENPVTGGPDRYKKTITYTAATLTSSQTANTGYTYVLTGSTTKPGESEALSFHYEPYPVINSITTKTDTSGATGGSFSVTSNYELEILGQTSTGITVSLENGTLTYTYKNAVGKEDESYIIRLRTTGIIGPAITRTINLTREGRHIDTWSYLEVTPATASIGPVGTQQLTVLLYTVINGVTGTPVDVSSQVTYQCSNTAVSISSAGLVTANNTNTAATTATINISYAGVDDVVSIISVAAGVITEEIIVSAYSYTVSYGGYVQLYAAFVRNVNGSETVLDITSAATWDTSSYEGEIEGEGSDYIYLNNERTNTGNATITVYAVYNNKTGSTNFTLEGRVVVTSYRNLRFGPDASTTATTLNMESAETQTGMFVWYDIYEDGSFSRSSKAPTSYSFSLNGTSFNLSTNGYTDGALTIRGNSTTGLTFVSNNTLTASQVYNLTKSSVSVTDGTSPAELEITVAPATGSIITYYTLTINIVSSPIAGQSANLDIAVTGGIQTTIPDVTSYQITGLTAGTEVYCRAFKTNFSGDSATVTVTADTSITLTVTQVATPSFLSFKAPAGYSTTVTYSSTNGRSGTNTISAGGTWNAGTFDLDDVVYWTANTIWYTYEDGSVSMSTDQQVQISTPGTCEGSLTVQSSTGYTADTSMTIYLGSVDDIDVNVHGGYMNDTYLYDLGRPASYSTTFNVYLDSNNTNVFRDCYLTITDSANHVLWQGNAINLVGSSNGVNISAGDLLNSWFYFDWN